VLLSGQCHELFSQPFFVVELNLRRFSKKTAKVIRKCEEIDGHSLFCYRDDNGDYCPIDSTDVNDYLREIADESMTAKDFRTWWGSVIALSELSDIRHDFTTTERKKAIVAAVAAAADALGNTTAICRKSYIHPCILAAAESGELPSLVARAKRYGNSRAELTMDETLLANLLSYLNL